MIQEEDRIKMSFSFAADIAKQLIALSTAIITLCVALADKLFSSQAIRSNSVLLLISLVLFVLSILSGLLCMMAITGTLGKPKTDLDTKEDTDEQTTPPQQQNTNVQDPNKGTIYQSNISFFIKTQMFMFLAGVVLSVVFLFFAACSHSDDTTVQSVEANELSNTVRVERKTNYTVVDSVKVDTLMIEATDKSDNNK